ncbi:hypothetical protein LEMLEM_LOCUS16861, partial [Lemmus lemmus]
MSAQFHGHLQGLLDTAHAQLPRTGPSGLCAEFSIHLLAAFTH